MINLKLLRKNPTILDESLEKRGEEKTAEALLLLDKEVRDLMNKTQSLQEERNRLAKKIGELKSKGLDAKEVLEEVSKTKEEELNLEKEVKLKQEVLRNKLLYIPNILHESVPVGKSEADNVVIKTEGTPKVFDFEVKDHTDLGVNLNMMDFDKAADLSGSRFVVLKEDLAHLERALLNFMLDLHTKEFGFKEVSTPVLVKDTTLVGTGQLPKFYEDMFKTENDKWLISTAEITLTNLVRDTIINEKDLPLRYTAGTLCFRSEAGASGRDTKGMLRQHQFYKVELVSIVEESKGEEELEYILSCAEEVLKRLKLPYRVMLLCSGDIGFSSKKTYDIEVWMPSQNCYREISSCSLCGDFQALRMNARYRKTESKEIGNVNTLNGSGLAVGRTLIATMENYQNEDGSIEVPEALLPYLNKTKIIRN